MPPRAPPALRDALGLTNPTGRFAVNDPRPPTGPTNGRPWPGDRIRMTRTGTEGTVGDYEWGWDRHVFPVRLDGSTTERMCTVRDVTVESQVVYGAWGQPTDTAPTDTAPTAAEPTTTATPDLPASARKTRGVA